MAFVRLPFSAAEWRSGNHPLERKKTPAAPAAALLEFAPGFRDPNWCTRGHSGLVLAGEIRFELEDRAETIGAGDGFHLDAGTRHRAVNPGPVPALIFIVSRD